MKKNMVVICAVLVIICVFSMFISWKKSNEFDKVEIYNTVDLTSEILENRNGKIIIEKMQGVVIDDSGNGRTLTPYGYYINYSGVENIKAGDIVITYFIYNPANNYIDEIIERFDYIEQ